MWKQGKENLQNNETGSLRRLQNLIVKLQKSPDLLETYDNIINNQLKEGIIAKVDKVSLLMYQSFSYLIYQLSEKMLRAQRSVLFMMRPPVEIVNQNY